MTTDTSTAKVRNHFLHSARFKKTLHAISPAVTSTQRVYLRLIQFGSFASEEPAPKCLIALM